METSNELKSCVKNIRFYINKIDELAKQQLTRDIDIGIAVGIELEPGVMRFDSLHAILSNADWIHSFINGIEINIKHAEEQDDKLRVKED